MASVEILIIYFEIILLLFKVNTNKHNKKKNQKRTAIIKQSKAKQEKIKIQANLACIIGNIGDSHCSLSEKNIDSLQLHVSEVYHSLQNNQGPQRMNTYKHAHI